MFISLEPLLKSITKIMLQYFKKQVLPRLVNSKKKKNPADFFTEPAIHSKYARS